MESYPAAVTPRLQILQLGLGTLLLLSTIVTAITTISFITCSYYCITLFLLILAMAPTNVVCPVVSHLEVPIN